jgi:hypothetical protein
VSGNEAVFVPDRNGFRSFEQRLAGSTSPNAATDVICYKKMTKFCGWAMSSRIQELLPK